jgi:hypothetical protein
VQTLHNLDCYLAWQGSRAAREDKAWRWTVTSRGGEQGSRRALKVKYAVPANRWVAKSRLMVKGDHDSWTLQDFEQV